VQVLIFNTSGSAADGTRMTIAIFGDQ